MTFTSEQSDAQIDVNDKNFWEKLLPASESHITPDNLLAQITSSRSSMREASARAEFFNTLTRCCERILEKRRGGEYVVEIERMIDLLITIGEWQGNRCMCDVRVACV